MLMEIPICAGSPGPPADSAKAGRPAGPPASLLRGLCWRRSRPDNALNIVEMEIQQHNVQMFIHLFASRGSGVEPRRLQSIERSGADFL